MSIWHGKTVHADEMEIDLKASDYAAPHATMYIELPNCEFEFTLNRDHWAEVRSMIDEYLT
jgi:hypothetical protein